MNYFLGAKVQRFRGYHNPTRMVNGIPKQGYAKCHKRAIVGVQKTPYLCTMK